MNILILHGIEGKAGDHWEQWLHDELVKSGHNVIMPQLPNTMHPDRQTWLNEVKGYMSQLEPAKTVIVAHSLGVPTTLDYLEQTTEHTRGFVSVGGFYRPYGTKLNDYFMLEKEIDMARVKNNIGKAFVLYGDDDPYVPQKALADLATTLGVEPIIFPRGGHLTADVGYSTFPKLLEIVKSFEK